MVKSQPPNPEGGPPPAETGAIPTPPEKELIKPKLFTEAPEGYEPMFQRVTSVNGGEIVLSDAYLGQFGGRQTAAVELSRWREYDNISINNKSEDVAFKPTAQIQELLTVILSRLPTDVLDFLLSDPDKLRVDKEGVSLIKLRYNLIKDSDNNFRVDEPMIGKKANLDPETNQSVHRRISRLIHQHTAKI